VKRKRLPFHVGQYVTLTAGEEIPYGSLVTFRRKKAYLLRSKRSALNGATITGGKKGDLVNVSVYGFAVALKKDP